MILNGKAKQDFYKFINKDIPDKESFECEMNINDLNYKSKTELNALIIEFFDSLKVAGFKSLWSYCFGNFGNYDVFKDNWNEHIEQAIKKANEIYNAKN